MTFVLDLFHALDCADAAMKAAAPRESERKGWIKTIKNRLNTGRVHDVIADPETYRRLEAGSTCIRT